MANYCYGIITVTGESEEVKQLYALLERLDDCAEASGFDAAEDWLGHIFKEEYIIQGIFVEGCWMKGQELQVQIRAKNTYGHEYFQAMASGLEITIKWEYDDEDGGKHRKKTFKPKTGAPKWELRTEGELDAGHEEDVEDSNFSKQSSCITFSSRRYTVLPS